MSIEEIRDKYAPLFYELVMRCEPKNPDLGVNVLSRKAEESARQRSISIEEAYRQIYEETRIRVEKRVTLIQACRIKD